MQEYLKQSIIELKLNNYPKTKTGYSTDSDTLKEYFKYTDTFGEHFRQHTKQITLLNKVSKSDGNPLDSIIDDSKLWYESLEPMGATTGRCTPKGKFIFGWHKSFYGLMEPPKGNGMLSWIIALKKHSYKLVFAKIRYITSSMRQKTYILDSCGC